MAEFISKFKKYRIWLKPARTMHDGFGGRHREDGLCAKFEDGRFSTQDQEMIALLKKAPRYGLDFRSIDQEKVEELSDSAKAIQEADKEALETVTNSCPVCSYKAQSLAGLKAHMRAKHKNVDQN